MQGQKLFAVMLVLTIAGLARADEKKKELVPAPTPVPVAAPTPTPEVTRSTSHIFFDLMGGANVLSYPSGITNTDNRITFMTGGSANFFFTDVVGTFVGLETSTRGFQNLFSGKTSSARFVDVPFGLAINMRGHFEKVIRPLIRVGGFLALPASSDFTGDNNLSGIGSSTKSYVGLYIDHQITWAVSSYLALGYTVWGKLPLGSGLEQTPAKFYEAGAGFVFEIR